MERVSESGSVDDGGLIVTVLQSDQIKMDIHTSGEGKGLLQRHLHESDSLTAVLYNLGSGSRLA